MIKLLGMMLRNPVARVTGFIIAPVLFVLWWQLGGAPGEVVNTSEVPGVITELHKHAYVVTLDAGQQVRVFRTRNLDAGTRVQLRVTQHESGLTQYMLPGDGASPQ